MTQKKILAIITDRSEIFTQYNIKFIKKFIDEIDEFYIITTEENYNNFFIDIIDFKHNKIFYKKEDVYPNKLGRIFYLYCDFFCNNTPENSIIYITGDGEFLIKNPFDWVKQYENNFDNYDIINCIHRHHSTNMCFDIGAFYINNQRSKLFFTELFNILDNNTNILLAPNGKMNLTCITNLSSWLVLQDIFWNIHIKNKNLKFLTDIASVKFFSKKFHWAPPYDSFMSWVELYYDSLFLTEECIINLLGKNKYFVNEDFYKYYYESFFDKNKIISKKEFIDRFENPNLEASKKVHHHYCLMFANKNKK
jgi:hypothetical protein